MEDEVERVVLEGQRARHIRAHGADLVALALGDHDIGRDLGLGVVEHGARAAHRREDRHLLAAAGRQAEHALATHVVEEPVARDLARGREHHRPVTAQRRLVALAADGRPPLPAVSHPRVHDPRVHVRIRLSPVLQ